jgi:release factor glutamine methyltransferase
MDQIRTYKNQLIQELNGIYDGRELENIWRILMDDIFRQNGFVKFDQVIEELKHHKPVQYITETEFFYGHKFHVNPYVLIPRPETEELVEWVLQDHGMENLTVLDVGSGSGCIPITIKLARPQWKVLGMELSEQALKVAKKNANSLNADVKWLLADMIDKSCYPAGVDIVVCNPPYVLREDKQMMTQSVYMHEPELALYAPDDDPLYFYRQVLHAMPVSDRVQFYFEIHHDLAESMQQLCSQKGLTQFELRADMQGLPRMVRTS